MKLRRLTTVTAGWLVVAAVAVCWAEAPGTPPKTLQVWGDLRLIADNELDRGRSFAELSAHPGLYGLGMPVGLNDELLVIDGDAYRSRFEDYRYRVTTGDPGEVAFFAYQYITDWEAVDVPHKVTDFESLRELLAGLMSTRSEPGLMFRLEANATYLRYFVVGGMGNLNPSARDSFLRNRTLGGAEERRIVAVGLYAPTLQGIATSPATPLHIHFKTDDDRPLFVGHIDDEVRFEAGSLRVFLPCNR